MRKTTSQSVPFLAIAALTMALLAVSCLPTPPGESGDITITLYGFSIMKESLEKAVFPGFIAKWKQQHGQTVQFQSSLAGSETVTNQILRGAPAEIAILSIERDVQRLQKDGFVTADWHSLPGKGIVNKTPFVIIVRQGNRRTWWCGRGDRRERMATSRGRRVAVGEYGGEAAAAAALPDARMSGPAS